MSTNNRPNIIIFNPDQWRGDVLGHLGDAAAVTPHLDALVASDGVSFRYAACQNTVCTPSRCSFMTGWYPHVRGHRTMRHMIRSHEGERTMLHVLREQGYRVWWGGKNDLVPGQLGFDDVADVKFQADAADLERWGYPADLDRALGPPGSQLPVGCMAKRYGFLRGTYPGMGDDRFFPNGDFCHVRGAVEMIEGHHGEQPFCCYLPLQFPHPDYHCEQRFYDLIDPAALPTPIPVPEGWEPLMRSGVRERMELGDWDAQTWQEVRRLYYGMCAQVDALFGLLVDALKRSGQYDNTLICFFSDHGDYTGDYGLVEKTQNTFEDCLVRVPLIIKPPQGVACEAGVRASMAELIDVPATIYDLLGIDPGYDHFGQSLLPVMADAQQEHRDVVFCEGGRLLHEEQCNEAANNPELDPQCAYWPRQVAQRSEGVDHGKAAMIRTERYKYVRRHYEPDQLFDLQADPQELHDRIDDPAYADIRSDLRERMLTWYMETCDVVPRDIDGR